MRVVGVDGTLGRALALLALAHAGTFRHRRALGELSRARAAGAHTPHPRLAPASSTLEYTRHLILLMKKIVLPTF